ncbi:MAG: citrate synthase [Firmicutes bacterium]|uniref:citrate/2-methylcitrate synthase n=1 Tax=Limnochorda sp. TaxID=1940279 RepID=UPI00182E9FDE|nr:citrate synthase [Bacillota bacterium]MBO2520061.1 citrate synthase [Bacillota bacterium]NMA72036.1 citrate synthase [Bacillota bacterium]
MAQSAVQTGLQGVVAAPSAICYIDGEQGILSYRGYDIRDLAAQATYEEVAYLLLMGELPTQQELERFQGELVRRRPVPEAVWNVLAAVAQHDEPMAVLRTGVSVLGQYDPLAGQTSREAALEQALNLIAQVPTLVAGIARLRRGQEPLPADEAPSVARSFLTMLKGEPPSDLQARALDIALTLHADHEFNASTFAARVTAATLSDMYSAITAAVGALKGPLHGGANQRAMEMLMTIGEPEKAEGWVREKLARKEKIMGIGHRVYKTYDPRARFLKEMAERLSAEVGEDRWYRIATEVERVVLEVLGEKALYPNVDFFSGICYHVMGIPTELFTPIFAMSRVSGWTAHVVEQYENNRLIRPRAEYTGPTLRPFIPLGQR